MVLCEVYIRKYKTILTDYQFLMVMFLPNFSMHSVNHEFLLSLFKDIYNESSYGHHQTLSLFTLLGKTLDIFPFDGKDDH